MFCFMKPSLCWLSNVIDHICHFSLYMFSCKSWMLLICSIWGFCYSVSTWDLVPIHPRVVWQTTSVDLKIKRVMDNQQQRMVSRYPIVATANWFGKPADGDSLWWISRNPSSFKSVSQNKSCSETNSTKWCLEGYRKDTMKNSVECFGEMIATNLRLMG